MSKLEIMWQISLFCQLEACSNDFNGDINVRYLLIT